MKENDLFIQTVKRHETRLYNCLSRAGLLDVEKVKNADARALFRIKGFGRITHRNLVEILKDFGHQKPSLTYTEAEHFLKQKKLHQGGIKVNEPQNQKEALLDPEGLAKALVIHKSWIYGQGAEVACWYDCSAKFFCDFGLVASSGADVDVDVI